MAEDWGLALDRILELTVLLHDDATRSLARDGLTPSRAAVLWTLRRLGPSPQRVLADELTVSPRNITGLVDALEADGFVTREPHPTDRRVTLVTLARRGKKVVDGLAKQREEFVRLLFEGMPGARFRGLVDGLDEVLRRLHDAGVTGRGARPSNRRG